MKILKKTLSDDKVITLDIEVEGVHQYILKNGVVSHNSSLSSGTTNSVYPIRDFSIVKTNNDDVLKYDVPESERLKNYYELAFDIPTENMSQVYGIIQKWTDQGISADSWKDVSGNAQITSTELLQDFFGTIKYGNKGHYYTNSKTSKNISLSGETLLQQQQTGTGEENNNSPVNLENEVDGAESDCCTL